MQGGFTETYCAWFEALPPEVAKDLAFSLMRLGPGGLLETSLVIEDPLAGFTPRLRRLASDPIRDAGTALMLATLTDFTFFERGNPRNWEKNEELLELLDEAQQNIYDDGADDDGFGGELSNWIAQNRLRYPLRARQWLKEHKAWQALRDGELDPHKIHAKLATPS